MSERCQDACREPDCPRDALAIHTRKITDSCRDKDCIEDLRVYLTKSSQCTLDSASSVRVRCAELLYAYIDVEPVAFDRNHYCIAVTFYYRVLADAVVGCNRPTPIFTSDTRLRGPDGPSRSSSNRPVAVVEVLDPMVLSSKVREICDCSCQELAAQIPQGVREYFDEELVLGTEQRRLFVTLGQFSLIRLERDAQLVVPVVDYSIPTKECCDTPGACAEDPCEIFSRIPFPEQQFVPRGCDRPCSDNCDDSCCN